MDAEIAVVLEVLLHDLVYLAELGVKHHFVFGVLFGAVPVREGCREAEFIDNMLNRIIQLLPVFLIVLVRLLQYPDIIKRKN